MSDDYGNDIITISDEDGKDYSLEHLDTIEIDDKFYMVFHPLDIDEGEEDYSVVILEAVEDDELVEVEDKDLLQDLYDLFMERLFEDDDINTDEE